MGGGGRERPPYDRRVALHEFTVEPDDQAGLLAWLDGPRPAAATPRGSSTVLLLREGPGGDGGSGASGASGDSGRAGDVEVFLLRRRTSMAFAGGMHAFPGGGVDPRDSDTDVPWIGPSPQEWGRALGCPAELASALVCAAVRELFEECGVLLAGDETAQTVVGDVSDDGWESDRLALLDRSLSMTELLRRRRLHLRSDLLRPWAHWTTPEFEPRRFDTWFFLAALPVGQVARDIGGEADRARWVGLDALTSEHAAGRLPMLPPTLLTVADVVAAVGNRVADAPAGARVEAALARPRRLGRVMPWLARDAQGAVVLRVDIDGQGGGRPATDGRGGPGRLP
jgi:8-oxo-dGTP pyrophosphatase MutT (NUDIX family)